MFDKNKTSSVVYEPNETSIAATRCEQQEKQQVGVANLGDTDMVHLDQLELPSCNHAVAQRAPCSLP